MNNFKPTLTIGIPTFNSFRYLPNVIESLKDELQNFSPGEIEVIISDNYSTDGTFQYLEQQLLQFDFILRRNPQNFGYEFQVRSLVESASGEFLWILGSQDCIIRGGLQIVINHLKSNPKSSHTLINFRTFSETLEKISQEKQYQDIGYVSTRNRFVFFRNSGGPALAVSANIMRTEKIKALCGKIARFPNWAHLEFQFRYIFKQKRTAIYTFVEEPVFTLMQESDGWWTTRKGLENYIQLYSLYGAQMPLGVLRMHQRYRKSGRFLVAAIDHHIGAGFSIDFDLRARIIDVYKFSPLFWLIAYKRLRQSSERAS